MFRKIAIPNCSQNSHGKIENGFGKAVGCASGTLY